MPIGDGPPGIETTHTWNGFLQLGSGRPGDPTRVKIDKITGFYSRAEATEAKIENTGRDGETPLPSYKRGKTIVYECRVMARTLLDLRSSINIVRAAFDDQHNLGTMTIDGDPDWFYTARVMQMDLDDEQTTGMTNIYPYQRGFMVGLRMMDPRFYVVGEISSGPHASDAQFAVTNDGIVPTDPIFTITVPTATPQPNITLRNYDVLGSDGDLVRLKFDAVPAGTFVVNFKDRSAKVGTVDVTGLLDVPYSDWWDELIPGLKAGSNNLHVTGGAWSVRYHHAG